MSERLLELKWILQTLSLPVSGQIHLIEDDCSRIERLASAFAAVHGAVHSNTSGALTPGQASVLAQLDRRLAEVGQQSDLALRTELAMRQSDDWREVRRMAREALLRFHWTLELPPRDLSEGSYSLN
jgi:hypothetical protein